MGIRASQWLTNIDAFISCRLDYCNSLLYALPAYQLAKLQSVQNAAARLIFEETKCCHITPLLKNHSQPRCIARYVNVYKYGEEK
jgi:hypothetical protein